MIQAGWPDHPEKNELSMILCAKGGAEWLKLRTPISSGWAHFNHCPGFVYLIQLAG